MTRSRQFWGARRPLSTTAWLVALLAPTVLHSQALVPSGTGFSVAGSVAVSRSTSSGSGLDGNATRPGALVEVAYGATPRLSLLGAYRLAAASAGTQDYTTHGVDFGLRYLGKAGMRLRPFAEGGLAIRSLRYDAGEVYTSSNVGPWASAGVMRLGAQHWSMEAAVTWAQSRFDNWNRDGQAIVAEAVHWNAVGVRAGVRYWNRAR